MYFKIQRFYVGFKLLNNIRRPTIESLRTKSTIIVKETDNAAVIMLNRPKYLNSLSTNLLTELLDSLNKYESSKSLVVIKGSGNNLFSTGGDLVEIYDMLFNRDFERYRHYVNYIEPTACLMRDYRIPLIVLLNGTTFGLSATVTQHCKYRISFDITKFGFPEVKVGAPPTGAATYLLNKMNNKVGHYLAVTGNSIEGSDLFNTGFATHYCLSSNLEKLEKALLNCKSNQVEKILADNCEKDVPSFSSRLSLNKINEYFSEPVLENVILKLKRDNSIWAKKTLESLNDVSPSAVKVIWRHLHMKKTLDFKECLVLEKTLMKNFYEKPDLLEGIRCIVKNKNEKPKWNPSDLKDVTDELVESYFK